MTASEVFEMLEKVKIALRISTTAYDEELTDLIEAAKLDLGLSGVETADVDSLIGKAIITYCKMSFGLPEDYDKLKKAYDEQKAQLKIAGRYRSENYV